jgi:hypothetical protein
MRRGLLINSASYWSAVVMHQNEVRGREKNEGGE